MKHIFEFGPLIVAVVIGVLYYVQKTRDLFRLWVDYDIAKLTGDKARALELGKAFMMEKKGRLTSQDEQVIASDVGYKND